MRTRTTLTVPTPCHENWATMTATTQGRHCAACNKVVVDFTEKTDAEILALLSQVSSTCGRFREDQLQRPLLPPPMPTPRWRTWVAATAAVLGLREVAADTSVAQHAPDQVHISTAITEPLASPLPPLGTNVRGWIRLPNGMALPSATVNVEGSTIQTVTAVDGSFSLLLPSTNESQLLLTLIIQAQGYAQQRVTVALERNSLESLNIYLELLTPTVPMPIIMGGLSATSRPVRRR
ncbi:carboxypeptidase-like regulatory domain-containing protein [Hymenobacter sp. YC55]|uniref:carboxypeptidase-like regulatory domain-containing protein n=1 Tax=Hymenobacter sp. YC55 TaxID=3034019 RepID=UPI0023F980A0|nr:carboxypeptidase-like regulatory domain-containing protein [Hymenobacter sp. YC55]MDF7812684.1 hypothetical protein [Hymenobacter sp. YC55]